jgi:hypothetical protein
MKLLTNNILNLCVKLLILGLFTLGSIVFLFNTTPVFAANPAACTAGATTNIDHGGDPACAGKVQYRILYKSINCTANTFDFEVQVKSDPLYPQPIMGDYNIRFDYDTSVMKRIGTPASQSSLIQRNRYANGLPASNINYGAQNLTGSSELVTPGLGNGIISLNGFFSNLPGDVIPTTFTTISTMRMDIVNPSGPLNINIHNATLDFPVTGNSIVLDDGLGGYDLIEPAYETSNIDLVSSSQNVLCAPPVDTTPPLAPAITGPVQNSTLTTGTPTFIGTAEPLSTVKVYNEFNQLVCTATTSATGNWTCTALFGQGEGRKSFTAVATDVAGNSSPNSTPPIVVFLDINTDSAPLIMENSAPNGGDNNNDGKLDSAQDNVTSKPNPNLDSNYSTLQVDGVGGNCAVVTNYDFTTEAVQSVQDVERDYPIGLFQFTIGCLPVGGSATVKILLDKQYDTTNWLYKKYNSVTKQYAVMPGVSYTNQTVEGKTYTTINYTAVDGGAFDEDGIANGEYTDPNGPTVIVPSALISTGPTLVQTGFSINDYSLLALIILVIASAVLNYNRFEHISNNKK